FDHKARPNGLGYRKYRLVAGVSEAHGPHRTHGTARTPNPGRWRFQSNGSSTTPQRPGLGPQASSRKTSRRYRMAQQSAAHSPRGPGLESAPPSRASRNDHTARL